MAINLDRLQSTLLVSGLQQRDQPLYQVISQLIKAVREGLAGIDTGGGSGGGSVVNNIFNQNYNLGSLDSSDGGDNDSMVIPGPPGTNGTGSGSMIPYYIGPTETFEVPLYSQALFAMNIDNEGIIDVEGFLIEVD